MNGQKPSFITPALIGGAVAGVLSGVPVFQCLCCLWIIGGAVLSAYLLSRETPDRLTPGDGALVGAFTGVFAAAASALISIPFARVQLAFLKKFFLRFQEYIPAGSRPEGFDRLLNIDVRGFSLPAFLFNLVILSLIFAALGVLGGVIGASLFGKKTAANRPSPPLPGSPS